MPPRRDDCGRSHLEFLGACSYLDALGDAYPVRGCAVGGFMKAYRRHRSHALPSKNRCHASVGSSLIFQDKHEEPFVLSLED